MKSLPLRFAGVAFAIGVAVPLLSSCASTGADASAVLARSAQAMGAAQLETLRYTAEGTGYTFGQAYKAGGAWPKVALHSVTRSIDYGTGTMREEVVLSRAEPRGGGGYPLSGQPRNDQFISGVRACNQAGTTATPGPRFVTDRLHQLWITPHGVLKAAMRGSARAAAGEAGASNVSFDWPGRFQAVVVIGADGLVRRVESTFADPVMGDTPVVTTYDDYKATGAIRFPTRVRQTMGGYPVLDLAITDVQANPSLALAVPEAARNTAERVISEKVADGIWFIAGGSHNSVLIELADRLILVETPLNDARTLAVIEHAKGLVPGKPIRLAVNSHPHFDHSGGSAPRSPRARRSSPRPTTCPSSSAPSPSRAGSVPTRWPRPASDRSSSPCRPGSRSATARARSRCTGSPAEDTATAS
jgi:hypothetical protein